MRMRAGCEAWVFGEIRGITVPEPADVAHLLRRAGFGGTTAQINTLAAQPWADIVDGLLDFSRPKATARQQVNLSAVVEDALFLLKHHQRFKRMTVERALATDLPDLPANQDS